MRSSPRADVRRAYETSPIRRVESPQRPRGHETLARASLRLWPGQILARLVLSTVLPIFMRGGLLGLELGVEHGEYDPHKTHQPPPARQADPQHTIEGVPVGLADHKRRRDGDVEEGQLCAALGHPDGLTPVGLPRCHRHRPYDTQRTKGVEESQGGEQAACELRESSQVSPGASRTHTEHLHEAACALQPWSSEGSEELLGPVTGHKRALHHAHDHWRRFIDLGGVHPHSFRILLGTYNSRPPEIGVLAYALYPGPPVYTPTFMRPRGAWPVTRPWSILPGHEATRFSAH